jgi:membrane protein YdbS with pleckstrin-like domain
MQALPQQHEDQARVLWQGRPSWAEFVYLWFFAGIALTRTAVAVYIGDLGSAAIFVGGGVAFVALARFLQRTTRYTVTRSAVHRTEGLFRRRDRVIPFERIAKVEIEQGPIDRLVDIGAVVLSLKDSDRRERLAGIREPHIVRNKIIALL